MQESASREEAELESLDADDFGEVNISGVHCTSGVMPTWSMSCKAGDTYFATVMKSAEPSWSSVTLCSKLETGIILSFSVFVVYEVKKI